MSRCSRSGYLWYRTTHSGTLESQEHLARQPAASDEEASMSRRPNQCPNCAGDFAIDAAVNRRHFLQAVAASAAATGLPVWATPRASAAPTPTSAAETAAKALY